MKILEEHPLNQTYWVQLGDTLNITIYGERYSLEVTEPEYMDRCALIESDDGRKSVVAGSESTLRRRLMEFMSLEEQLVYVV